MKREKTGLFPAFPMMVIPGLLLIVFLGGCESEKYCKTRTIALNEVCPYYDGQWQGIIAASDGACYFGTSSHTLFQGGGFFRFDPKSSQLSVLAEDLTDLAGYEPSKDRTPQGKCHSPVIEVDGTLYLSTHIAAAWEEARGNYPGSYILAYDMNERIWHNYGIVKPRYSTYSAIEVDPERKSIYAMIVPFAPEDTARDGNHLFRIDIQSGEKKDLGRLSDGLGSFWFYLDYKGRVWTPIWQGSGKLHCYDPELDSIFTYKDVFPEPLLAPDGSPVVKSRLAGKTWTWAMAIEGRRKCLFTMGDEGGGDERLWIFDPDKDIPSGEAFTPICYIGSTFLSVDIGGNRLFYIQRGDYVSERDYSIGGNRELPPDKKGYHVNNLHLRSVSLNPADGYRIVDHGRIIDQDGRTPGYICSLAADDSGHVFMSGSWTVLPDDQPTIKYNHKTDSLESKNWGEFFAWVDVKGDI